MKKKILTFFIIATLLSFTVPKILFAQAPVPPNNFPSPIPTPPYMQGGEPNTGTLPGQLPGTPPGGSSVDAEGRNTSDTCGVLDVFCNLLNFFFLAVAWFGNIVLGIVSWLLWACGVILNLSIVQLVVRMKSALNQITIVYETWAIMRDFVNMFFIFILLAIAIQTILQIGGKNLKQILVKFVLIALFLNFSFFFTGVLIDFSNTMALMFYKGFAGGEGCGTLEQADGCLSYNVVKSLKLSTLYVSPTNSQASLSDGFVVNSLESLIKFLTRVVLGSWLMIVMAGIFLASAVFIIYRFAILIFCLMFSPFAFAAQILPSTEKYWREWWNMLSKQLIFAPVYFMFLWVVMRIITSGSLGGALGIDTNSNFNAALGGQPSTLFALIVNYAIVIFLMGYSLKLANDLGAGGTKIAGKIAGNMKGFIGRNTVGRASYRLANSQMMQGAVAKFPFGGRLAQAPLDSLSKASFGGKKGGYEQAEKDRIKDAETQARRMGPSTLMVERARTEKEAANKNAIEQRKVAEATVNEKYAAKENLVSEKRIGATRMEMSEQQKKLNELNRIIREQARPPEEIAEALKQKASTEQAISEKQKSINTMQRTQKVILDNKNAEIEELMKPHKEKLEAATSEEDRIKGIDEKTAKDRVRNNEGKIKEGIIRRILAEGKGRVSYDEAKKQANEEFNFDEEVNKLMRENQGIAKERQAKYAKSTERDYGASKIASIGENMEGPAGSVVRAAAKTTGFAMNTLLQHTRFVSAAAAIRKQMKGKTKAEEFFEEAKKEVENAAKEAKTETETPKSEKPAEEGGGGEKKSE